jgi:phage baseplate assembly protein W
MKSTEFLGKGLAFPIDVDQNGSLKFSSYQKSVEESITIILSTQKGERMMNPDFGCRIHELLFKPNSAQTHALAEKYVIEALRKWENRIVLKEVKINSIELNKILIDVEYQLKDTNSFYNFVYPFYLIETP